MLGVLSAQISDEGGDGGAGLPAAAGGSVHALRLG